MKDRLLILGRLAHDPQGVLATVYRLARMAVKGSPHLALRIGLKLRIAAFTYAEHRWGLFHDSQLALWHVQSLARLTGRV